VAAKRRIRRGEASVVTIGGMDGRRVGRLIRAVRHELGLRQADLARAAGVSQRSVSRVESGGLEELSFDALSRVARAIDVSIHLEARWHGGAGDRLIDRQHAALVQGVAEVLRTAGWQIVPEFTFNHFGERGSVDLVAWHEASGTLLLVEVKSRLTDLQDLFARIATKVRVVPKLVAAEHGWQPKRIARLLVLPGTTANRSIVERHRDLFASSFPARAPEIRRWLRDPRVDLAGLWFITASRHASAKRVLRVRRGARSSS
jgi:transcriptional regulator with XRE-family HTH domain